MLKNFGLLILVACAALLATGLGVPVDDASNAPRGVKAKSMESRDEVVGHAIPHVESRQPLEVAEAINEPRYADGPVMFERDEQSLEDRDDDLIKLKMDCGSEDQNNFCAKRFLYYCGYRGLETRFPEQNFACQRECECYNERGQVYVPPYVPIGPWTPIGEVDNGAKATRDDDSIEARDEDFASIFEEAEPAY